MYEVGSIGGFFALFVLPHLILFYRYPQKPFSLLFVLGFIISFSLGWFLTLFSLLFDIPSSLLQYTAWSADLLVPFYIFFFAKRHDAKPIISWWPFLAAVLLLIPVFRYIGTGFTGWDAVVSWHRWALELYDNTYHPMDAAYPILFPALWSLLYKLQGNTDIWFGSQVILTLPALALLTVSFSLYRETKRKIFLIYAFAVYPFLVHPFTVNGYMDAPVAVMGAFSLLMLIAAEHFKNDERFELYFYVSILLSALASITKQSGCVFLLFTTLYFIARYRLFKYKKLTFFVIFISYTFFLSYLAIFFLYGQANPVQNLSYLKKISLKHFKSDWETTLTYLYMRFTSYPIVPQWIRVLLGNIAKFPFMSVVIFFSFAAFVSKKVRSDYLAVTSALFFIIGTLIWIYFFSYDDRNSYWVKIFLVLLFTVNIDIISDQPWITLRTTILLLFAIAVGGAYTIHRYKNLIETYQRNFQRSLSDENFARYIDKLLSNKNACVKLYTNDYYLRYNYFTKNVQNKIKFIGGYDLNITNVIEHNCTEGRYLVLRDKTRRDTNWWRILRLYEYGLIKPIEGRKELIYSIPPRQKVPQNIISHLTRFVHKKLHPKNNENIHGSIDSIKRFGTIYKIEGWALLTNLPLNAQHTYLLLENEDRYYIIDTKSIKRPDVAETFHNINYLQCGFQAIVDSNDIRPGIYNLSIIVEKEGSSEQFRLFTDKHIHKQKKEEK
jgi:hypothetical protein